MSTREERAEATRAHLIATATELFAARGYGGVGTEDVVRAAGLTRGALYHHFADKRELFAAVHERLEQQLVAAIAERMAAVAVAPEPAEPEPVAPEPAESEPAESEPAEPEPVAPEPAEPDFESAEPDFESAEPDQPEPPESDQPEPPEPEPPESESAKSAEPTEQPADPAEPTRRENAAIRTADALGMLTVGMRAFLDACTEPEVLQIALLDAPTVLGWARWREVEERYGLGLVIAALEAGMAAGALRRQDARPLAHLVLAALGEAAHLIAHADDPVRTRAEVEPALLSLLTGLGA